MEKKKKKKEINKKWCITQLLTICWLMPCQFPSNGSEPLTPTSCFLFNMMPQDMEFAKFATFQKTEENNDELWTVST